MIDVFRNRDDASVTISGKEIDIREVSDFDDFLLAECELDDLSNEFTQQLPAGVHIQINSEDGFGTDLFHELTLSGNGDRMSLAFECTTPNKYWEGQYGLATYLSEIRNQIDFHDNWRVAEIFLEEDWKGITLERLVEFGAPPYEATEKVADISGRPVDKFAEPFNTKHWNVGNRIHDLGNGKVRVDPTTVQTPNPFFKN